MNVIIIYLNQGLKLDVTDKGLMRGFISFLLQDYHLSFLTRKEKPILHSFIINETIQIIKPRDIKTFCEVLNNQYLSGKLDLELTLKYLEEHNVFIMGEYL